MPFPWEQIIKSSVQIGTQYAQSAKLSSDQKKSIQRQFGALDIEVAALYRSLLNQATITPEQLNGARQAFQQLATLASQYGSIEGVATQWQEERPRLALLLTWIEEKAMRSAAPAVTAAAAAITRTVIMPNGNVAAIASETATPADNSPMFLIAALAAGVLLLKIR